MSGRKAILRLLTVTGFFVSVGFASLALQPAQQASALYDPPACSPHDDWDGLIVYQTYYFYKCPVVNVTLLPHRGTPLPSDQSINNQDDISYGYVIPRSSVGGPDVLANLPSKTDFYNRMYAYGHSADSWAKMGAAYVVHLALGDNAKGSTTITPAQWADFANRLSNPDLTMSVDPNYNITNNSGSFYLNNDMNKFPNGGSGIDMAKLTLDTQRFSSALLFKLGGATVFALEIKCSNVLGTFDGLPPYNPYDLTPTVTGPSGSVEVGGKIASVIPHVKNTGGGSVSAQWQLTETIVPPLGSISKVQTQNTSTPIVNYGSPANSSQVIKQGTRAFASGDDPGIQAEQLTNITVPDKPAGTQICFGLSINPYSAASAPGVWRHSPAVCVVIAKSPKFQIWGGDARVGGKIMTSATTKDAAVFGSWVEYGAMSTLTNTNFASGSGLNGGSMASAKDRNGLTFANIDNSHTSSYGQYASTLPASMSASYFSGLSNKQALPNANISSVAGFATGKAPLVYTTGDVTLTQSGPLAAGKSVIILSTGTVTINKDLTYTTATLSSTKDIPQLIIIAKHINITDAVKQVDAWLLTTSADNSDSINTCSNVAGNLTTTTCANALVINGPVATRQLDLRRTAGSGAGPQSGDPAEVINLRADVYMWGRLEATGLGKAQTVDVTELPPRF